MMLGSGILGTIAQFSSIGAAMHVTAVLLLAATVGFGWAAAEPRLAVDEQRRRTGGVVGDRGAGGGG